jgi:hypothetical protein
MVAAPFLALASGRRAVFTACRLPTLLKTFCDRDAAPIQSRGASLKEAPRPIS